MPPNRKREPIFATSEREALIQLVEQHFHIVESKKTDFASTRSKNEEWKKIAEEFSSISGIYPRDWLALKNCWENIKKRAKKEQTMRNQHFIGTGGGPPKKQNEDPMLERVLALLHRRVTGYINSHDDDGINILASGTTSTPLVTPLPVVMDVYNINDTNISEVDSQDGNISGTNYSLAATTSTRVTTRDWSQYNSNMLRENINPVLARSPSPSASNTQLTTHSPAPAVAITAGPSARLSTSRRRPTVRKEQESSLSRERFKHLLNANVRAEEEHDIEMAIKKEILEQEKIETRQEQLRLEILEIDLQQLKQS